jgi:hypothetical protein
MIATKPDAMKGTVFTLMLMLAILKGLFCHRAFCMSFLVIDLTI